MQCIWVKHLSKIKKIQCEKLHVWCLLHNTILTQSNESQIRCSEPFILKTTQLYIFYCEKTWLIGALSLIGCLTESEWVQWDSLKIHQKIPCRSGSTFVWKLRDEIWLNILQRIRRVVLFTSSKSAQKSFPQTLKPKTDKLWQAW